MAEERDPKLSQRYRDLGAEEPPRALDQTILSAARRALEKPHAPLVTPAGRHRWYFSLGAAAVIVLAVAVTYHMQQEVPDPDSVAIPPAPDAQKATAPERAREPAAPQPPVFVPDPKPQGRERPRELPREAPQVEQRPAPPESRVEQQERIPAPQEPIAPAAAPPAAMRGLMSDSMRYEPPERWLERIVQLRTEGRHDEADKLLVEFRRRYPDYRISDAMLEKVEKK